MDWEVLAHGYGLAEAPTIDTDGSVVFSDVLGGGVYRLDGSGDGRDGGARNGAASAASRSTPTAGSCAPGAT